MGYMPSGNRKAPGAKACEARRPALPRTVPSGYFFQQLQEIRGDWTMKIKSTIVVAAAAGSAFAPNANAQPADASMRAQRMTPAPVFTWTGFYVGAHVGY